MSRFMQRLFVVVPRILAYEDPEVLAYGLPALITPSESDALDRGESIAASGDPHLHCVDIWLIKHEDAKPDLFKWFVPARPATQTSFGEDNKHGFIGQAVCLQCGMPLKHPNHKDPNENEEKPRSDPNENESSSPFSLVEEEERCTAPSCGLPLSQCKGTKLAGTVIHNIHG